MAVVGGLLLLATPCRSWCADPWRAGRWPRATGSVRQVRDLGRAVRVGRGLAAAARAADRAGAGGPADRRRRRKDGVRGGAPGGDPRGPHAAVPADPLQRADGARRLAAVAARRRRRLVRRVPRPCPTRGARPASIRTPSAPAEAAAAADRPGRSSSATSSSRTSTSTSRFRSGSWSWRGERGRVARRWAATGRRCSSRRATSSPPVARCGSVAAARPGRRASRSTRWPSPTSASRPPRRPTCGWRSPAPTTGRAKLSGHAVFLNIFPPGRTGGRPAGRARRRRALGQLRRRAHRAGRQLAPGRRLGQAPRRRSARHRQGPFNGPAGTLQVDGGGTRLTARVAHGAADLTLAFAGVETGWMLDPALRPLLGGLLHGHLHATARLWPTFAGIEAEIPDADLRLDRRRAPSGPAALPARHRKDERSEGATDTLYASVTSVRLADAILRLDDLRVDWTGLTARVDARVAFAAPARQPTKTGPASPRRDALRGRRARQAGGRGAGRLDPGRRGDRPPAPVGRGARDDRPGRARAGLPAAADDRRPRPALPAPAAARRAPGEDGGFSVPRFTLRRVGGGTIEVGGRIAERRQGRRQPGGARTIRSARSPGSTGARCPSS